MTAPFILWLRQELRLDDQPAVAAACAAGPVIPVYVLDDETPGEWRIGGAQRWWLHGSLAALAADLKALGARLILRRGATVDVLRALLEETGAAGIHAIRHYEPWHARAEGALADRLTLHESGYLVPPADMRTGSGQPFRIFSPFWRALAAKMPPPDPLPAPEHIAAPAYWPASDTLDDWHLLPTRPNWASEFPAHWQPGEAAARAKTTRAGGLVEAYDTARNLPTEEGTSRLSPHLHFGEVSPATVWHAVAGRAGAEPFQRELAWRDFTTGVIAAMPDYATKHGRAAFDRLPWRTGNTAALDLDAWRHGRTGYPIVDAGMRQLWTSGWMHNRVRMITASFLVKHLLIDWREGERWFWDTLVDADYGNNTVNWQWIAGSGVDANMFGRIMAPLVQSEKFGAGDYIRRWVPELAGVPDPAVHDPDVADARPPDYPAKIIGHREGRERALAAAQAMRG